MKLKVESTDRIGISQEILSVIAASNWNLVAMEVSSGATYLHIDAESHNLAAVNQSLKTIAGVVEVSVIEVLPTESKEQHLHTLLSRLPEPIFDVDENGNILFSNQTHFVSKQNRNVFQLLSITKEEASSGATNIEVRYLNQPYIAEISPVLTDGNFNGAVIVLKAVSSIGKQIAMLQQSKTHSIDNIVGESEIMQQLKQQLVKFARLDLPILLTGETGTGKELFARAIHEASERSSSPFLAINCASLSEHLLESELFGYAAGAFTGAQKSGKPGLFELAAGGTVFLDEIAEMSGYLQAKLLRFLQDYSYRRVGGTEELTANVRIISASHQPLNELISDKVFREDLYYRLNVLTLALPALRERQQDIFLLINSFIKQAAKHLNQKEPPFNEQAVNLLAQYQWPGNIRQLQNVIFRLVALHSNGDIEMEAVDSVLSDFGAQDISKVGTASTSDANGNKWTDYDSWQSAQAAFEEALLSQFSPLYPSTRKLAQRLKVSHNKIAMKLRQHQVNKTYS